MSLARLTSGMLLAIALCSGCRITDQSVGSAIDAGTPQVTSYPPDPADRPAAGRADEDENPFRRRPESRSTSVSAKERERESFGEEWTESRTAVDRESPSNSSREESRSSQLQTSVRTLSVRQLQEAIDRELPEASPEEREQLLRDLRHADPALARQILSMHRLISEMQADRRPIPSEVPAEPRSIAPAKRRNIERFSSRREARLVEPDAERFVSENDSDIPGRIQRQRHSQEISLVPSHVDLPRNRSRDVSPSELEPETPAASAHRVATREVFQSPGESAERGTLSHSPQSRGMHESVPVVDDVERGFPSKNLILPVNAQTETLVPAGTSPKPQASLPRSGLTSMELQRAIAAAEAELAGMPSTSNATDEERRIFTERHVSLRMLYWMAGHSDRAMQAIPGIDAADQEFWQKMIWSVSDYFDGRNVPNRADRASQTVMQLRSAVDRLQETARLELRNVGFCQSINGFGNYTRFPRNEFSRGQRVLFYAEITNFKSVPSSDNQYLTQLRSTIEFYNASGGLVHRIENLNTEDVCSSHRRDYYQSYQFNLPGGDKMQIGPHSAKLIVVDELSRKVTEQTVNFTVTP